MDAFGDNDQELDEGTHGKRAEVYGVPGNGIEVDSDVNDDPNREQQLDDSFQSWYNNIEYWVRQKKDITQVPGENVFDAAIQMEDGSKEE